MKNFILLIVLNIVVPASLFAMDNNSGTSVGDVANDFTIKRIDGTEFRLSDYKGKKSVNLVFWATWCSNCKAEIPALKTLTKSHGDDIEMLAINVGVNDSMKRLNRYREKYAIDYPMAFDETSNISRQFGVMGTPTLMIIDINGIIRYRGAEVPDDIADHIDGLMGR